MTLTLMNGENNSITCTLWGDYVTKITPYLENCISPPIIILQMAQVKEWKGKISLSNAMYGGRIFFGDEIPEIAEYRKSLKVDGPDSTNVSIFCVTTHTTSTGEFSQDCPKKTIQDLCEEKKKGMYIVVATVDNIEMKNNWYYMSCVKCNSKVTIIDDEYYCKGKCEKPNNIANISYRVEIRVMDETSSASFVLFDNICEQLFGKTAPDLKAKHLEDPPKYPSDFDNLLGKKYVFKVQINDYNLERAVSSFRVAKISEDKNLIGELTKSGEQIQESVGGVGDNGKIDDSETPTSSKAKRFLEFESSDESDSAKDELSATKPPAEKVSQLKKVKIEKEDIKNITVEQVKIEKKD